ncbi:MAG: DUF5799 family protein [Halanaeroarchaeum sp.]
MPEESWRDRIVGARMAVDDQFADRVEQSSFSRQQWGLVMTATEFEIENADDPQEAQIVPNTDHLDSILPELDDIERQMQGMDGGNGGSMGASMGGIVDDLKDLLGMGEGEDGVDESRRREAVRMVTEYAEELQRYLEERGRWNELRELAASEA